MTDVSSCDAINNAPSSAEGQLAVAKGKGIANPVPTGVGDSLEDRKKKSIMNWKRKVALAAATNITTPSLKGSANAVKGSGSVC